MHHELRTEVEIAAPTEAVWETLTDLAAYPDWNPFIVSAEGRATVGERLTNRLPPPGGKADGARVRGHERGAHGTCRSRRRVSVMTPPSMPGWNLALRFGLDLAALAGLAAAAWKLGSGPGRWIGVVAVPVAAATVWGVFNVLDDPSRSGAAPVEVNGEGSAQALDEPLLVAFVSPSLSGQERRGVGDDLAAEVAPHGGEDVGDLRDRPGEQLLCTRDHADEHVLKAREDAGDGVTQEPPIDRRHLQ